MKSRTIIFNGRQKAELHEIDVPEPKNDEVLAKTLVNGICMWEVHCFNNLENQPEFRPGHEGIGVVIDVGRDVKRVKPGDYITTSEWGEYTLQKGEDVLKLSSVQGDAGLYLLEPLACVINAVAHTHIYPGDRIFISGCGYMGLLLLKLIAGYPVSEITVSDIKMRNLELAGIYGAHKCIDAADTATLKNMESDSYDVVFECSGTAAGLELCNRLVCRGGTVGLYAWHHGTRTVDTDSWHEKGTRILNLSPGITANERGGRSFAAAERLTCSGRFSQEGLVTHRYKIEDAQRAMEESTLRKDGFIKSIFEF